MFFKWWWAVITAIATFLPLFTLPDSLVISKGLVGFVIFLCCFFIFITFSVVAQGYKWYLGSHNAPMVASCLPAVAANQERDQADEVITINSVHDLELGQVLTVFREANRGVGCFGLVKVDRQINPRSNQYQCSSFWIAPIHKRDLSNDQVQISQLSTSLFINYNDLVNYIGGAQQS